MTLTDLSPEETALVLTFRRIRLEQHAADDARLGFAVAANAEKLLVGPVVEQWRVDMLDTAGVVLEQVLAATEQAAADIATAWQAHGWATTTSPVITGGAR